MTESDEQAKRAWELSTHSRKTQTPTGVALRAMWEDGYRARAIGETEAKGELELIHGICAEAGCTDPGAECSNRTACMVEELRQRTVCAKNHIAEMQRAAELIAHLRDAYTPQCCTEALDELSALLT